MGEPTTLTEPLATELARCRQRLTWTEAELRREQQERANHLQQVKAKLAEQIHVGYQEELTRLKTKLAEQDEAHRVQLTELTASFAAKEKAYKEKLRELTRELAMYKTNGPAHTGSEKMDDIDLKPKGSGSGKPRSNHGGGRNIPTQLPTEVITHHLEQSTCPACGCERKRVDPAVSHEVDFRVQIRLLRHEREKCARCRCGWEEPDLAVESEQTDTAAPAPQGEPTTTHQPPAEEAPSEVVEPASVEAVEPASVEAVEPASAEAVEPASAEVAEPASSAPFITAALPPKAMLRSLFTDRAWIEMFVLKYVYQVPANQIINIFANADYQPHSGTLCDGFARFCQRLLAPLDGAIIEHNLTGPWWAADSSSLRLIKKDSDRTHSVCWQVRSPQCTVYFHSLTGEAEHIQTYFADATADAPILMVDRASTFKTLWFSLVFCWAHVRRDFVLLGRYEKGHRGFAITWLRRIRKLYRLHKSWRLAPHDSTLRRDLRKHLRQMEKLRDDQLARTDLPEPRRKVLTSLREHWTGLTRFVDDPRLPLDNNAVERNFRPLARFRHNCQACHSENAATTMVRAFTVIQTLIQNQIAVKPYLLAWCEAIAQNGGEPPEDLQPWLPWQLTDAVKQRIAYFKTI